MNDDAAEIQYRAEERLGILMDDRGREPTREEVNWAWWQAVLQVREMNSGTDERG